ncbi:hypothetical protein, partial [Ferruginibacter sp.]|uniref:hypothetical protein n=1 Tax=Ferruginibacter sp. TaxID=1940288 RepID=UPI0026594AE4
WFGLTYCGVAARFFTAFIGLACISNVLFDLQLKYTNVLELLSRPYLVSNVLTSLASIEIYVSSELIKSI